jgi:hypothetical protein
MAEKTASKIKGEKPGGLVRGLVFAALYGGLLAAVAAVSVALVRAGAFWPLPAFVLPLSVTLARPLVVFVKKD